MTYFKLRTPAGFYEADTIIGILWLVVKHRFWHWKNGDGWID